MTNLECGHASAHQPIRASRDSQCDIEDFSADHVLAAAELREQSDREVSILIRRHYITVVLDGVAHGQNLGAIFRLCDAFPIRELIICGIDFDASDRNFQQASRGAERWVTWSTAAHALEPVAAQRKQGAQIIAAELTEHMVLLADLKPRFPAVLVLGGETAGVSRAVLDAADVAVAIPTLGMGDSLNVTAAAAILLYELSNAADDCGAIS